MGDKYEVIKNGETENYQGFEELRQLILAELQRRSKGSGTSSIVKETENGFTFNRNILRKYKDKYNSALSLLNEIFNDKINFFNARATINAMAELMIDNAPDKKEQYDVIPALSTFYSIINDWSSREEINHGCDAACSGLCNGVNLESTSGNPAPGVNGQATAGEWQTGCSNCSAGCLNVCEGCTATCGEECRYHCGSECQNVCDGECAGTCLKGCQNACNGCHGNCYGECAGKCRTTCTNTCRSCDTYCNSCTGSCSNTCSTCGGSCSGKCGAYCSQTCQYSAYTGCSSCANTCSNEAMSSALYGETSTDLFQFTYEKDITTHEEADYDYIEDNNNNWVLYCYESGFLTITNGTYNVDIHAVGGGGAGGGPFANTQTGARIAGHGGGSGYIKTQYNKQLFANSQYTVTIGAGGVRSEGSWVTNEPIWAGGHGGNGGETYLQNNNSEKIISALGGEGGHQGNAWGAGSGGSGGGLNGGYSGGSNCENGGGSNSSYGRGQNSYKPTIETDYSINAYDFEDTTLILRAKGGNGGPNSNTSGANGRTNMGDGGEGAGAGNTDSYTLKAGDGGSGILIIRNHRE